MATKQGNENRHLGRRVEFYMPDNEYDSMIEVMQLMSIANKSDFLRSSIKTYCDYQKSKAKGK